MSTDIVALAERLDNATLHGVAIAQLSDEAELTLEDAYRVQKASIERRLARGDRRVGVKLGFTSRAKMVQMGVSDLIWGRLTEGMIVEDGGVLHLAGYVHPRVEAEVAFLMRKPLSGRVTPLQALDAVEAVACALEIIDSRYEAFRFSLADVIADNASASGFVVGPWRRPDTDTANLGMILSVDGRPEAFGSSSAILGHPLRALVAAARVVVEGGEVLEAGSIVLAGAATAALALAPGQHISLETEALGRVQFAVAG
jgi:2-oxo-3-hexenedioate decarboxylase